MNNSRLIDLFRAASDEHVPTPPPASEILGRGVRAARNRLLTRVACAGVAVMACVIVAALALSRHGPDPDSGRFVDPAPSSHLHSETTGTTVNTWTDYTTGGGAAGKQIPVKTQVEVSCRVRGFEVADGNVWWYRIHSAPWSDQYYGSADAFFNGALTDGSLKGTPFFDPAVPLC